MGLFSPNPAKQKQIELQNLLFNTEEKKLMVSTDFLNNITTSYVSKRMKNINKMTDGIVVTKNPNHFFAYCEAIEHDLEELIRLEPYHAFKQPVPSEFKKLFNAKMGQYTEAMIKRTWRDICQKTGLDPDGNRDPKYYGPVLEAFLKYKDKYSPANLELVDKFYKSVYGISFTEVEVEEPEVPEVPETEEVTEAAEEEKLPQGEPIIEETVVVSEEENVEGISISEEAVE